MFQKLQKEDGRYMFFFIFDRHFKHLIFLKMVMDIAKEFFGRWINPFKKFSRLRIKVPLFFYSDFPNLSKFPIFF